MNAHFPALEEAKAELRAILAEAGSNHDLSQVKSISGTNAEKMAHIRRLNARIAELKAIAGAAENGGNFVPGDGTQPFEMKGTSTFTFAASSREWATETAQLLTKTAKDNGVKALTSGSVDAPTMVRTGFFTMPQNPARLLDLLVDRVQIPGNAYEYLLQTTRTDAAAAVADNALKPTSIYTVTSVQDRPRVYAHLSEAIPLRLFDDHQGLQSFLESEMSRGVLDKLEADIVSGAASGENVTGILNTVGIGSTAFTTSMAITLRKARTAMEAAYEAPTAWVLNPADVEFLDLLNTANGNYVVDASAYANIFGNIPRVVSNSVPAGTALLADWTQCRLYVRQGTTLDADRSGALFTNNQVKLRAEGRFGFAVNRPSAFRKIALV